MEPKRVEQLVRALFNAIPWWLRFTIYTFALSSIITALAITMIAWSLVSLVLWNFG